MQILKTYQTLKINCPGGILPLAKLEKILRVLDACDISKLKFGLRQNIFIEFPSVLLTLVEKRLQQAEIDYELDPNEKPNIMSSYAAIAIFNSNTWLTEAVFKDILAKVDYVPSLKINITDSIQALTPVFTGNINWIASEETPNYWHLFIRFPKTNTIIRWPHMLHTADLITFSKALEKELNQIKSISLDTATIEKKIILAFQESTWNTLPSTADINWPVYNMPYYEGLNKYNEHYWLGIYRRQEWFEADFLSDLVKLGLETHISEICITAYKSLIIKNIQDTDRSKWNHLLNYHSINIRHGLNELNFQVEDTIESSLKLKNYLVKYLNEDDVRTSGIAFGIKSKPKTEVFSNILIRKRHLISLGNFKLIPVYDILLSKDFNPHERTGMIYRSSLFKYLLPGELHGCIREYYRNRLKVKDLNHPTEPSQSTELGNQSIEYVYQ